MALIIDFLLLAASGAACFYCWTLSKRLNALTSTKDGFQTGIAALSQSAEEMQEAMSKTKSIANDSAVQLEALLQETEQKIPELRMLIQEMADMSTYAVNETETATRNLVDILSPQIKEARDSAKMLLSSLEDASRNVVTASSEAPKTDSPDETANSDNEEIGFISAPEDRVSEKSGEAA